MRSWTNLASGRIGALYAHCMRISIPIIQFALAQYARVFGPGLSFTLQYVGRSIQYCNALLDPDVVRTRRSTIIIIIIILVLCTADFSSTMVLKKSSTMECTMADPADRR